MQQLSIFKKTASLSTTYSLLCLPVDIWKVICTNNDVQTHIAISKLCKSMYALFGGVVEILTHAIKIQDCAVVQRSSRCAHSMETFLHPLRWALFTQGFQQDMSPTQLVTQELARFNLLQTYFANTSEASKQAWAMDRAIVAGGFVRAIFIRMFRLIHRCAPNLTDEACDIDIFIRKRSGLQPWKLLLSDAMVTRSQNIVQTGLNNDAFAKQQDHNILTIINPNQWSQTLPIQVIEPQGGIIRSIRFGLLAECINGFDFTCTQVAIYGDHWWKHPKVMMTPAFLYSLCTGKMFLNYAKRVEWPFQNLETSLCFQETRANPGKVVTLTQKLSIVNRFFKYRERGYTDLQLSEDDCNRLRCLRHEVGLVYSNSSEYMAEYNERFDFLWDVFAN
jgi:hypothetical protein